MPALVLAIFPSTHLRAEQTLALAAVPTPPAIEVVGRRAGGAYYNGEASGAKSDLALRELPQAVRILTRQSLDDLGAVRMDDALDYVGGVSRQNSFGGLWDNVAIRGLAGDINNGMALLHNGFAANRGFNAARDTANIERLEFLKGTAASLYGASEPGGTINVVTKRPLWRSAHAADLYAGSDDFYRAAIDSTGPLSEAVAYRVNAAVERRGSFRDHLRSRRALLAPGMTWKISPTSRFDYRGEILRNEAPLDRGVVAIDGRLGAVPRERFLGEPADGDVTIQNHTHQFVLDHDFSNGWSARLGLAYKEGELSGFSTEAQPALQGDGRTLRRQRRYRDYQSDDVTLQAELNGRFRTGALSHHVMAGVEAWRFNQDQLMLRANPGAAAPYSIDVLAPVYGQVQPIPQPNTDLAERHRNLALYAQDSLTVGNWRLLAGVRLDRNEQHFLNRRSNLVNEHSPGATSPRLGVSYLPNAQWTLFANTGKSFRPNNGADAQARSFAPERGRAMEAGAKWENEARSMGATLSAYHIRKQFALTADPANPGFSVAAGAVRSRGLDADFSGQISRAWRLNASLSFIDAAVVQDRTLELSGRLLNVPKTNASLLMVYEGALAGGSRFGVGGGATYTGKRLGEARTQAQADANVPAFELPGYGIGKLLAYWQVAPKTRVSLDIDNLFDRTYYSHSVQRTWVNPGAARSATLGMQIKF